MLDKLHNWSLRSPNHLCLVSFFVAATSNVVFPGVGGLGCVSRPVPHQAAEHLSGSS